MQKAASSDEEMLHSALIRSCIFIVRVLHHLSIIVSSLLNNNTLEFLS